MNDDTAKLLSALDGRKHLTTDNLVAYKGEFYTIDGVDWCDLATESYKKIGSDLWEKHE